MGRGDRHPWTDAGNRRTAAYNRLPPGRYRFVVSAALANGTFGDAVGVSFTRRARWQETAWFPYAITTAIIAAAGLVYWVRLRQVRTRFATVLDERNRMARELHDTLAQDFAGIATQLSGVASALRADPSAAERHLDVARRMTQHSLTEARRSILDLRSSALTEGDLRAALESMARETTAGADVAIEVSGDASPRLDRQTEHQLLRMAQEAVANAVKHARARRVEIELRHTQTHATLTIRDDGIGFDPDLAFMAARGHFGLLGMRERARRLGGDVRFESAPGAGTSIIVTVPAS